MGGGASLPASTTVTALATKNYNKLCLEHMASQVGYKFPQPAYGSVLHYIWAKTSDFASRCPSALQLIGPQNRTKVDVRVKLKQMLFAGKGTVISTTPSVVR